MKTATCKTRWIGALVTLMLLVGLTAGIAPAHADDGDDLIGCPRPLYAEDPWDENLHQQELEDSGLLAAGGLPETLPVQAST